LNGAPNDSGGLHFEGAFVQKLVETGQVYNRSPFAVLLLNEKKTAVKAWRLVISNPFHRLLVQKAMYSLWKHGVP
jgi:hypothetical protein